MLSMLNCRLSLYFSRPPLFLASRHASRLVYSDYGPPSEVISLETFEAPEAKQDQIVIKMLASPVHPADVNTIQGTYPIKPKLPAVGGGEGVGEVVGVGENVSGISLGDWVVPAGNMTGTWTTHMVATARGVIRIRKDISVLSAATLRTNPGTAYRMLKDFVALNEGDFVIQNGANSAVGRAVVEIAKVMGVNTINVVRDRDDIDALKDDLQSLGANFVWTESELRKTTDFREKRLPRPKLALNCVGGKSSTEILASLAKKGVHVTYGGMSLQPVITATSALIFKDVSVVGFWMSRWIEENYDDPRRGQMYDELGEMAAKGQLNPPKHVVRPLTEYKDVMENCMRGFKPAKYIFDMR